MKIKVSASFSGVIARGSYENARPGFAADVEFELADSVPQENGAINQMQQALHKICYDNFKAVEEQMVIERIQKDLANMRFYDCAICNKKHPSVTSIIGFDSDMFVSPEDLQQYASQSNLCHAQAAHFIDSGKWLDAKDVPGTWTDIVILTKGALKLEMSGWDFPAFLAKYPISDLENGKKSGNCQLQYGGTPDFTGIPQFAGTKGWESVKKVKTLWDIKRTADKVKNFKQMAAYVNMDKYNDIEQIGIVVLNNKTKQGFSEPIIESDPDRIKQYFSMFKDDREAFKKRFGI